MTLKLKIFVSGVLAAILLGACATAEIASSTAHSSNGFTFLHLNDTYRVGAVEDGNRGGFGRVTTVIHELQNQGRAVRILHGGDFLYPSLESQIWNGEQLVE